MAAMLIAPSMSMPVSKLLRDEPAQRQKRLQHQQVGRPPRRQRQEVRQVVCHQQPLLVQEATPRQRQRHRPVACIKVSIRPCWCERGALSGLAEGGLQPQ